MNRLHRPRLARGVVLAVAVIAYFFLIQSLERAKENYSVLPVPTSYNSGPFGAKGFYLLLRQAGYRVSRNTEPITSLPDDLGVLVLLEPQGYPALSHKEKQTILTWVEKGHSLLLANSVVTPWMGWETLTSEEDWTGLQPADTRLSPTSLSRFTEGVTVVQAIQGRRLTYRATSPGICLRILSEGTSLRFVALRRGRGWIAVASDASLFTNRLIAQADNALFALNVLQVLTEPSGRKTVWLDEYHHGYTTLHSMPHLVWKPPVRWIALQALLAVVLFFITEGKRFGQPISLTPGRERPRSGRFVSSLANIYRKAGARDAAYAILRDSFHRDLVRVLQLPATATLRDILAAANQRGVDPKQLEPMLQTSTTGIDEASFVTYSRSFEEIRRRLSSSAREYRFSA